MDHADPPRPACPPDDAIIARIDSFCDRRCERCAFTTRCLTFLYHRAPGPAWRDALAPPAPGALVDALRRTLDLLRQAAAQLGVDPEAIDTDGTEPVDPVLTDPLVSRTREYAHATYRIVQALAPIAATRGDPHVERAVDDLASLCTTIASQTYRAVLGDRDAEDRSPQRDANGSAKCARLFIQESIRAWRVLMEVGRAAANGVPARLVAELQAIDDAIAARFPDAMAFVRPGFDEAPTEAPAA